MSIQMSPSRLTRMLAILASTLALVALLLLALSQLATARPAAIPPTTDLFVDKLGPVQAYAGTPVTYTLMVTNATGLTLEDVVITDTWYLLHYTGTYAFGGDVIVSSTADGQFNLQPLPPYASGWLKLRMSVPYTLQPSYKTDPTILGNNAMITTSTPGVTANSDNVNTLVVGPVLRLTKSIASAAPRPGRLLTYTFMLGNCSGYLRPEPVEGRALASTSSASAAG